jgi:hypothetical protein
VGRLALLAPPGTYTVKLSYAGVEATRPLVVRKDPSSGGSEQEIAAQTELLRGVQTDLNDAVDMINRMEAVRGQLVALRATIGGDTTRADVRAAADSLDRGLAAAEEQLFQVKATGRGQDGVRWPGRLAEQLVYLANSIGGSDYAPTESQRAVAALLHEQARSARAQVDRVLQRDVTAFNEMLRRKNLQNIIAGVP